MMMKKIINRIILITLCLCLATAGIFTVSAADTDAAPADALHIKTPHEFIEFSNSCRLDSFSKDLSVSLDADLDLSAYHFSGVPIFCGTFYGNGHKLSGISIESSGSTIGLFRYVTEKAVIRDLNVEADVLPEGSRNYIGGIAGSNAGTIENCNFDGQISGTDRVGGIAGINTVTGSVVKCTAWGNVHGDHFVGGIAGENAGVIRECDNHSEINITAKQNSIEISDINLDNLLGTEAANTVTDIGGIAGTNTGVIRGCANRNNVGYAHMGYNIGGIAGTQQGYITECKNFGKILGRKEVGGIVGQMEPTVEVAYSEDTLQILKQQIKVLNDLVKQVAKNAAANTEKVKNLIVNLEDQIGIAYDAIQTLLPQNDIHHIFPTKDEFVASVNALNSSLGNIKKLTGQINDAIKDSGSALNHDLKAFINQLDVVNQTVGNASDTLGGQAEDASDEDTDDKTVGKISNCHNFGLIQGDTNTAGIVGAIAWENDLGPDKDIDIHGESSLNINCKVRAVVRDCVNMADISCKKRNGGGIAGWVSIGLIKDCANTGTIDSDTCDCVGGIVGYSTGYIRSCSAKCELSGDSYVGGIAGNATVVTDCRSCVFINEGKEFLGAILGYHGTDFNRDENPLHDNYYLTAGKDLGAIDGISYDKLAQAMNIDDFLALPDQHDFFRSSSLTFLDGNQIVATVTVPMGQALDSKDIPAVPRRGNNIGVWDGLRDIDRSHIYFNMAFEAAYKPCQQTIRSVNAMPDGRPLLLAQGMFIDMDHFQISESDLIPELPDDYKAVISWEIPAFETGGEVQLRYGCPSDYAPGSLKIMVQAADGTWHDSENTVNGNYLVFSVNPGEKTFCVVSCPSYLWVWILLIAAGVLLIVLILVIVLVHRHHRKRKAEKLARQAAVQAESETGKSEDSSEEADKE